MKHGTEHQNHFCAGNQASIFALSFDHVGENTWQRAVVTDRSGQAEWNPRADAFVKNPAREDSLFDRGCDAPAASNRVDGAKMVTMAAMHRGSSIHVYPE